MVEDSLVHQESQPRVLDNHLILCRIKLKWNKLTILMEMKVLVRNKVIKISIYQLQIKKQYRIFLRIKMIKILKENSQFSHLLNRVHNLIKSVKSKNKLNLHLNQQMIRLIRIVNKIQKLESNNHLPGVNKELKLVDIM